METMQLPIASIDGLVAYDAAKAKTAADRMAGHAGRLIFDDTPTHHG